MSFDFLDWIPVRIGIERDPAVLQMASDLRKTPWEVVGMCIAFWGWVSENCEGPRFGGFSPRELGTVTVSPKFVRAMIAAKWLEFDEEKNEFCVPHFERWLSKTARRRLLDRRRKAKKRQQDKKTGDPENRADDCGNHADTVRTSSGHSADIERTSSGQTSAAPRAPAHACACETGELEKDTSQKYSFSNSTLLANCARDPDSGNGDGHADPNADADAGRDPAGQTVSPAADSVRSTGRPDSGAGDASPGPGPWVDVDPAELTRMRSILAARKSGDVETLERFDAPVPDRFAGEAGGNEGSEPSGPSDAAN